MAIDNPLQPRGGLLDMMGQGDSGFAGWLNPRRNAIINFGAGMIGADSARDAMRGAAQGLQTGRQQDTAYAMLQQEQAEKQRALQEEIDQRNQTTEWLRANYPQYAGLPPAEGFQAAMAAMRSAGAGGGAPTYFGTPIPYQTEEGIQYGQLSNSGEFRPIQLPEGSTFAPKTTEVDLGNRISIQDQFGNELYSMPKSGTVPAGYNSAPDGAVSPMPGSPQEREVLAAEEQARMKAFLQNTYSDIVIEDIDRVLESVTGNPMMNTGPVAAMTQGLPGMPAYNTKQLTDTIRANVGFDRLQQMREASPTGGALGAVSEFENRLLQATLGNLELSQDLPQLQRNLERLREVYMQIVHFGISPDDPLAREIMGGTGDGSSADPLGIR